MIRKKANSFTIFSNVIFAFFMRELKTRFGQKKYGYFWMFVEPLFHILILSFIFSGLGRTVSLNISFPMFLLLGLLPYFLFNNISNKVMDAVSANRGLLAYSPVKIIDPIIARVLLEVMISTLTFITVSLVFIMADFFYPPEDILKFVLMIFVLVIFSFSLGLIFAIIKEYYEDFNKVTSIILKPLYYTSGIFYTAEMIPTTYREYFLYNPILVFIEAMRAFWFKEYTDKYVNYEYIFGLTLFLLALSLYMYKNNQEVFKVIK